MHYPQLAKLKFVAFYSLILRKMGDVYIVSGEGAHTLTKTDRGKDFAEQNQIKIHGGINYEYGS